MSTTTSTDGGKAEATNRHRFAMECEFVQCLASPDYILWLARHRYFDEPEFINYLSYLRYWKRPEYAKVLSFPQCLRMLEALQDPQFRSKMKDPEAVAELKKQQAHQWLYFDRSYADLQRLFQYQL